MGVGLVAREEFTATGAQWTVQTGLRAARIITITQAASGDEQQRVHSQLKSRRAFVIVIGVKFCHSPITMHRVTLGRVMMESSSYDVIQYL